MSFIDCNTVAAIDTQGPYAKLLLRNYRQQKVDNRNSMNYLNLRSVYKLTFKQSWIS